MLPPGTDRAELWETASPTSIPASPPALNNVCFSPEISLLVVVEGFESKSNDAHGLELLLTLEIFLQYFSPEIFINPLALMLNTLSGVNSGNYVTF